MAMGMNDGERVEERGTVPKQELARGRGRETDVGNAQAAKMSKGGSQLEDQKKGWRADRFCKLFFPYHRQIFEGIRHNLSECIKIITNYEMRSSTCMSRVEEDMRGIRLSITHHSLGLLDVGVVGVSQKQTPPMPVVGACMR
eukprot:756709-Hanusia_phi.AAC.3